VSTIMSVTSLTIDTRVYDGQKPGTSGLRKSVKVFQQEHYTENFVQAILQAMGDQLAGCSLVVGGDGRFYCREAVMKIIRIAAANGVRVDCLAQGAISKHLHGSHVLDECEPYTST